MASKTIEAAGGIVVRKGAGGLIAVVQRSKDDAWVLPRGKLKRDEDPVAGARREVVEETGHRVEVHEYLGAITYRAGGRPKVVQFWRMEADAEASYELMPDIVAVDWLPLKAAVRRLHYPLEKLFLRYAIARALKKRRTKTPQKTIGRKKVGTKTAKPKTAKPKKTKSRTVRLPKKAALKSKTARASAILNQPAKAAKASNKTKNKADKKSRKKVKDKFKNKAKNKAKNKNTTGNKARDKSRASRKADKKLDKKVEKKAARKAGKPKKDKAKKTGRDHPHAIAAGVKPAVDPKTASKPVHAIRPAAGSELKAHEIAALPNRAATPAPSDTRSDAGEHKTILQRVLGRLGG